MSYDEFNWKRAGIRQSEVAVRSFRPREGRQKNDVRPDNVHMRYNALSRYRNSHFVRIHVKSECKYAFVNHL